VQVLKLLYSWQAECQISLNTGHPFESNDISPCTLHYIWFLKLLSQLALNIHLHRQLKAVRMHSVTPSTTTSFMFSRPWLQIPHLFHSSFSLKNLFSYGFIHIAFLFTWCIWVTYLSSANHRTNYTLYWYVHITYHFVSPMQLMSHLLFSHIFSFPVHMQSCASELIKRLYSMKSSRVTSCVRIVL
jgi:hypothetical protein